MAPKDTEACGRCSMTSVVSAASEGDDGSDRDPFGDARIEVPEDRLRRAAAPQVLLGRAKRRIDQLATKITYGR
ncbi:hypothetical protein [Halosimplex pelagicum]|uniref:Uncharacterized protein n=1 Tax=Halosimplex pelagicum TaxID=869886 RepID=A0A7D5PB84_9EURY|nr:hypothetical protein [Halosimplex pelagicum]QLH81598.1 hypothetical protein HZS54_08140 [Halosimplex pelagicum]